MKLQDIKLSGEKSKKQIAIYDIIHSTKLKIYAYIYIHMCPFGHSARQQGDNDRTGEARAAESLRGYCQELGVHPPVNV